MMGSETTKHENFVRLEMRLHDIVVCSLNPLKVIDQAVAHKFVLLAVKYRLIQKQVPPPRLRTCVRVDAGRGRDGVVRKRAKTDAHMPACAGIRARVKPLCDALARTGAARPARVQPHHCHSRADIVEETTWYRLLGGPWIKWRDNGRL